MIRTPEERAKSLFDLAEQQGLDAPTESMVQDAINDAMADALANYSTPKEYERFYSDWEHRCY